MVSISTIRRTTMYVPSKLIILYCKYSPTPIVNNSPNRGVHPGQDLPDSENQHASSESTVNIGKPKKVSLVVPNSGPVTPGGCQVNSNRSQEAHKLKATEGELSLRYLQTPSITREPLPHTEKKWRSRSCRNASGPYPHI